MQTCYKKRNLFYRNLTKFNFLFIYQVVKWHSGYSSATCKCLWNCINYTL